MEFINQAHSGENQFMIEKKKEEKLQKVEGQKPKCKLCEGKKTQKLFYSQMEIGYNINPKQNLKLF